MKRKEMLARLKNGEDPLELSIEKWQDIVDGKGEDEEEGNCALCATNKTCLDCPVYEKTEEFWCQASPYVEYVEAEYEKATDEELKDLAQKELEFLKSLRKEA